MIERPPSAALRHKSTPIVLATALAALLLSGCSMLSAASPDADKMAQTCDCAVTEPDANPADAQATAPDEPEALAPVEIFAREITFKSLGDTLAGVIERPKEMTGAAPAVLILHDAGPRDRRGHFKNSLGLKLPVEVPVYQELAANLVRHGFVVMRFDKRTCVEGGRPWCTYPREYIEAHRDELARALKADAAAAIEFLRKNNRVDPKRIFLLGHGQGADIALALTEKVAPAGLVLLAPSPYPIDRVIQHQTKTSLAHLKKRRKKAGNTTMGTLLDQQIEALRKAKKIQTAGFAALRSGDFDEPELLGAPTETWLGLLELHRQAHAQLRLRKAPILAVFGEYDATMPARSAAAFRKSAAQTSDAATLEVVELPKTTHLMVAIDESNQATDVSDKVQQLVVDFLYAQSEKAQPPENPQKKAPRVASGAR
jgi:dienelactone hydrolase